MFLYSFSFSPYNLTDILISLLVVTLSLSFHEYAHGRMALAMGDDTARLAGRLTLNPLAHLDPIGTLVFIFARVGWARPVPVNPARFTKAKSRKSGLVWVSLAGPLANLLLAFISVTLLNLLFFILSLMDVSALTASSVRLPSLIFRILNAFFLSNIFLAIFNLLPVPPLDGYKIFGALLPDRHYFNIMRYEQYIGMAFLFLVMFGGNFISRLMNRIASPVAFLLNWPSSTLFELLLRLIR